MDLSYIYIYWCVCVSKYVYFSGPLFLMSSIVFVCGIVNYDLPGGGKNAYQKMRVGDVEDG